MYFQKLTKRFLMQLPEGHILTSNCFQSDGFPIFFEPVAPLTERHEQWKRIKAVGRNGRTAHVYTNEKEFLDQMARWFKYRTEPHREPPPMSQGELRLRLAASRRGIAPLPTSPALTTRPPIGLVCVSFSEDASEAQTVLLCLDPETGGCHPVEFTGPVLEPEEGHFVVLPMNSEENETSMA